MAPPDESEVFKSCGSCGRGWRRWGDFVLDPAIRLLGLQAAPDRTDVNLLVFEHDCGTSISILTRRLAGLLPERGDSPYPASLRNTERCERHCLVLGDFEACSAPCINAKDRELLRLIVRMRREARGPGAGS